MKTIANQYFTDKVSDLARYIVALEEDMERAVFVLQSMEEKEERIDVAIVLDYMMEAQSELDGLKAVLETRLDSE